MPENKPETLFELRSSGGKARAKSLTAKRRKEIAKHASDQATKVRQKKARERKKMLDTLQARA